MENKQKICKNCNYYIEHYAKTDSGFVTLHEGHCINHDITKTRKTNKYASKDSCENWESDEIRKNKRKEGILNKLEKMCENISYIAQILKEDNGKDANT